MRFFKDGGVWLVWLALFGAAATLLRGYLALDVGLAPDEAYYWRWSTALSLSYPDHPPLAAWLIRLGTAVAGENGLGVRLIGIVGALVAMVVVYRIARETDLERRHAAMATGLAALFIAPAAAAFIITPDTPLGVAWLAAQLAIIRLQKSPSRNGWCLLGIAVGFAILSKYSGALLLPVVAMSLRGRILSQRRHATLGALVAVLILLPHLFSEWRLGFPAGFFQGAHLKGGLPGSGTWTDIPSRLLEIVSGQAGLLTPVAAIWIIKGLRLQAGRAEQVLSLGFLVPLVVTVVAAFFTHPEQNWASLGHPGAAVLAVAALTRQRADGRLARGWGMAVFGVAAACFILVHVHLIYPILPLPPKQDPTARLFGWRGLDELSQNLESVDGVVCDNYGLAAEVAWHYRKNVHTPPIVGSDRALRPMAGRLLILDQAGDFGAAVAPIPCRKVGERRRILLKRRDGRAWDLIEGYVGAECRLQKER